MDTKFIPGGNLRTNISTVVFINVILILLYLSFSDNDISIDITVIFLNIFFYVNIYTDKFTSIEFCQNELVVTYWRMNGASTVKYLYHDLAYSYKKRTVTRGSVRLVLTIYCLDKQILFLYPGHDGVEEEDIQSMLKLLDLHDVEKVM
ncbi:MAG: hypothetical protein RIR11_2012 [Bacteroidota bacterium]|jgi:hypothetical protein